MLKHQLRNLLVVLFLLHVITHVRMIKGDVKYVSPKDLNNDVSGFFGFKCNFSSKGVHNIEPILTEKRSLICSIYSYFIYDKIKLTIPNKTPGSKFKMLPEKCFETVYTNYEKRTEEKIENMGLVEYEVKEDNSHAEYTEKIITISPFNTKDVEFFCICDNSENVISNVKGRVALVHVNVLKYPHKITSINLTTEPYSYLPNQISKSSFTSNKLDLELQEGELVVLACEQVDDKCFKKEKSDSSDSLYKSNKVVYHENLAIFKAPVYVKSVDVSTECSCKVGDIVYTVSLKPIYINKLIHGCNFSSDISTHTFTNNIDMAQLGESTQITCNIDLVDTSYNHLIGMNCPGEILPECFFQVYQRDSPELEPSKMVYLDAQLNIGNVEYYQEKNGENTVKIFGLVGSIPQTTSFTCICRKGNKIGYMSVKVAAGYFGFLAKIFILLIVLLLLYF
ncbi:6-cysteine protein [Plasmodium knowlesi strain H]|uniref:6-cysteine protein n=3 Tax=Plasmodium knowlesi TaxID=5850 RepID=A0A5K1VNT4_PLAKH|nr:6-cysteine protein [Plasmodium knowlesi strain H]OTN66276.1 6-cysteine protein [Plasmodium knowlesi]CAA9989869.1 6-cysteine protein [Plasmodium knowlesi strain H]SBO24427.1 6-cysteine protein [Plasmodium knowlesi strain H]SBO26576.1 6-cysteine protein [Plasmodium knowlesi strain H]VVS79343.1 6-cysteine protein [Plasmodium knowlesi strain H]|eukprot:XP_002259885.1 transmission blocking target antigen precursor,putative [Plasmodium knowlesi strain H]